MNNEQKAIAWLKSQGISEKVLFDSKVHWDERTQTIVFPIFDKEGIFLFDKRRRAPWSDNEVNTGPKYRYDAGATAQLYNAATLFDPKTKRVLITEGEKDSLVARSNGYDAVSTTGGAGTFLADWAPWFKGKEVVIIYDTDEAGIKGSFKVQGLIPHASIVWLPKGKDVTEFFLTVEYPNSTFADLVDSAKSYAPPQHIEWDGKLKKYIIKDIIKANEQTANYYLHAIDLARQDNKPYRHLELLLELFNRQNESDRKRLAFLGAKKNDNLATIAEAKKVPITNFLDFPYTKTIKCIWHTEDSPSMHYYDAQNVVKCFGCDKRGDVIDVVQQLNKCSIQEAIKIILKK
jgi:DNA primase